MEKYRQRKREALAPHPKGTIALTNRERTKTKCWFQRFGCRGHLEIITKFADGSRVDDPQSVCSKCGVLYIGNPKRAAENEPTISFKVNWLNKHRDIMEAAKQRRFRSRSLRWLKKVV